MMVSGTTRQVLAGLSASLSALSTGLTYSWSSPILEYLVSPRSHIPMTRDQSSWVVSCMEFGCWVTPVLAGKLADSVGRKLTLLATGPGRVFVFFHRTSLCSKLGNSHLRS
uniref:Uncharacterized protein n=1 Tax=Cacopsylla melanoneura TaxID=428564 RepID=A0A8D8Q0T2_9HEMI